MSKVHTKTLTVKYAPLVDREKLLVCVNRADKPADIEWYEFISIEASTTNRKIVCKLYGDDIAEIADKQEGLIRINEPLCGKLGIAVEQKIQLGFTFRKAWRLFSWYYFIRYHPDDYVRVST